jgi:hypothetical protein
LDATNLCVGTGGKEEGQHRARVCNAPSKIPYSDILLLSLGMSCNADSHPDLCESYNLVINFKCQNGVDSDYIFNEMYVPQHPFVVVIPREGRQFLIPNCK